MTERRSQYLGNEAVDAFASPVAPPEMTTLHRCGDAFEGRVGCGTDRRNRGQTDDDDQRQHHGVFNSCRAIFGNQKLLDALSQCLHRILPLQVCRSRSGEQLGRKHTNSDWPGGWMLAQNPATDASVAIASQSPPPKLKPHNEVTPKINDGFSVRRRS